MTKTSIYLIRHGECAGNKENRVRGRVDFRSMERYGPGGSASPRDDGQGAGTCLFKPAQRALTTAETISRVCGCGLSSDDSFSNIRLDPWQGRLKSEIAASEPELWNTWISDPESLVLDGAETLDQVMERSLAGLQRLMEKHKGETFAVVSHRGVLKPMLSGALGIAKPRFWRLHMDTGSYSLLTHDDVHGFCLMGLNYSEHLKNLPLVQEFE